MGRVLYSTHGALGTRDADQLVRYLNSSSRLLGRLGRLWSSEKGETGVPANPAAQSCPATPSVRARFLCGMSRPGASEADGPAVWRRSAACPWCLPRLVNEELDKLEVVDEVGLVPRKSS